MRLTARGIGARLGLVTWLAAMTSTLISAALALVFLIKTVRAGWPELTLAVCREVAGNACTPVIYRSALYELGLAAALFVASVTALAAAWRYGRKVQRSHRQTAEHGRAVRIVGRELPGTGAVVLEDSRPAAYCAAGTIVLTRGAIDVLDDAQLATVLAHERAHLSGRHHLIVLGVRGLAAAFPGVPLFGRGLGEVMRLSEMSADDAAVRVGDGRRAVLAAALVAIATGTAVPGEGLLPRGALAAAAYAVQARVERMLRVPSRSRGLACVTLLAAATLSLALLPVALTAVTA
jgi:Zn-dependent protease with chaperone function